MRLLRVAAALCLGLMPDVVARAGAVGVPEPLPNPELTSPPPVPAGLLPTAPAPSFDATRRKYFPHWARPASKPMLRPIVTYKLGETKTVAAAARTTGLEGGGIAGWKGYRLLRGNAPGLELNASAGGAAGFVKTTLANARGLGASNSAVRFHRYYAEASLGLYWKPLHFEAAIARGVLRYQTDAAQPVQDIGARGKGSLRITRWLDLHGSTFYRHVFAETFDDPTTVELLTISTARVVIDDWNAEIEAGPGVGYTQESSLGEIASEGWIRTAQMRIKVSNLRGYDFHGKARYVLATSDERLGRYATMRLSRDNLYEAPQMSAPEDTMSLSAGLVTHYDWLDLGYWMNWVVFDYSERDGRKSHTNREVGIGAFFGYEI